jgi:cysteine desulfurase
MNRIYLDYNATCPIRAEVMAAMMDAMRAPGNPSSLHFQGRGARKIVEDARALVAALVNVRSAQVIFNAGATEGNNTILSGYQNKVAFIGASEHPSIVESAPHAKHIPVDRNGVIDLSALDAMLESETPALVSVQLVNSETGVIQPVAEIAARVKAKGALIHCDAVQGAGRIGIDFKALDVDYLTLSAHKFGGPHGAGALIFREGLQMPKFMRGGGQEKRQRAGTENVAAIAGFGVAAKLALEEIIFYQAHTKSLQTKLESGLRQIANDIVIVASNADRVTNTSAVIVPNAPAETMLMGMDLEGIAISSGSACSSGTFKPSHVLTAMGYSDDQARSALRFSSGYATTLAEIDDALAAFARVLNRIRK